MKRFVLSVFVFAAGLASGIAISAYGYKDRGDEIDSLQHVYLQTPGKCPKPEYPLCVMRVSRAEDDDAEFREHNDTWRVYLAEIDTVIYLEQRKGK